MREHVERTEHRHDASETGTERMVSEGGPIVPGKPAGRDRVSTRRWESFDAAAARDRTASLIIQAIYFLFGLVEGLVGLRVVLLMLGADPQSALADFIYSVSSPLVAPFGGISSTLRSGSYVLEVHSVLALAIYALLAYLLARFVRFMLEPGTDHGHRPTTIR